MNRHCKTERRDQSARCKGMFSKRGATRRDTAALCCQLERGQRGVQMQSGTFIDAAGVSGLQPDSPAFVVAKHVQQPVMAQIFRRVQRNPFGQGGSTKRRNRFPGKAVAVEARPVPGAV